ncbi:glutaredoxin 2 [Acetobacter sp. AN02]|nr:glutaredoxin 2 [Acetobacter sp. AN02]
MPFGLKNIPFDLRFQLNDDEETPIRMIGKKMLPILEGEDGFMGESLDIVRKIDGISGPALFSGEPDQALVGWMRQWGTTINSLVIPRTPYPVFAEFRTQEARAYFTRKKEEIFGNFDDLLSKTDTLLASAEAGLKALEPLLPAQNSVSIDDIMLFPLLRSLSILPDIKLPDSVRDYQVGMAERSGVPLVRDLRASV